jgi:hypothetical protein
MRGLIALSGQADTPIEFVRPRALQATIVSHYARDYIDVLELADDAFTQIQRAWLLGLLGLLEKRERATECHRALRSLKEHVYKERSQIGALVREVNAGQHPSRAPTAEAPLDDAPLPFDTGDIAFEHTVSGFLDSMPGDEDLPTTADRPQTLEEPLPSWTGLTPPGLIVPWLTGAHRGAG